MKIRHTGRHVSILEPQQNLEEQHQLPAKFKLYKALVVSVPDSGSGEEKLSLRNKVLSHASPISCSEHKTNEFVRNKVAALAGPHELLAIPSRGGS